MMNMTDDITLAAKLRSFGIALNCFPTDKNIMVGGGWITGDECIQAAHEITRLRDELIKASREIQGYKDALAQVWTDTNGDSFK